MQTALNACSASVLLTRAAGAGVFELRMDFEPGDRAYFGKDGERLVILLLCGTNTR